MKNSCNRTGIKAAILTMSFIQMTTNAIAPILANIMESFPEKSITSVQYLMTFPNLLAVIMSVITGKIATRYPKKVLEITGLVLASLSGIGSFLFHNSLTLLYVWAGMLGIGIGLVVPIATSLISDYFSGEEQEKLLGFQTSAANIGSMLMTFFGGMLAVVAWHYTYLVYLLAVPGLILSLLFIPKKNVSKKSEGIGSKIQIPKFAWLYFFVAAIFMLLFYMGPTNLSILVKEKQIGSPIIAGNATTLLLLGGSAMGLIFGKISGKIGKNTIPMGFLILFMGYMLIYSANQILLLYLGSFFVGTSNTLVLPQCMGQMITDNKKQSTFLMSVVFAVANIGTFLAPGLTGIATLVMRNDFASSRFLFTAITALVLALSLFVLLQDKSKQSECDRENN